jgi:hypothetical protein
MKKTTFWAKCPCCGEKLIVDMRLRRIDAAETRKAKRSTILDEAGETLEKDEEKREDSFEKAFDEETQRKKPSLDDYLE